MFDVRDHIKKLLLLVPAGCVVLAAGITISGYEAQPVRAKEKSIPEFQLVKEETESKVSLFDYMETVTLPEAENQTKEAVVLTRDTSESDRTYKDGTYYGSGTGFGGKLMVEVVIQDGKIVSVTLVENEGDDHPYIDNASALLQSIVAAQSTNVDAVSGATYSSAGLIEAVRNALAQAAVSGTGSAVTADQTVQKETQASSGTTSLTGAEEQGKTYRNGTYTGMAVCVPDGEEEFDAYTLTLNVTIADDKIVGISDIKGSGDRYISANDRYLAKASAIAEKIIQSGGIEVDAVSGATCSSNAIRQAVKNAMEQARITQIAEAPTQQVTVPVRTETVSKETQTTTALSGDETEGKIYKNGIYTGTARCIPDEDEEFEEYLLSLQITVVNDKIVAVSDVKGSGDGYDSANDRYISKAAQGSSTSQGMVDRILASGVVNEPAEFDVVSKATCSSNAIVQAVMNALEQAKRGSSGETTETTKKPEETTKETTTPEESTEETTTKPEESTGEETTKPEDETGKYYKNGTYHVQADCEPDEDQEFEAYTLSLDLTMQNDRITKIENIAGSGAAYDTANNTYIKRAAQGTSKYTGMVTQILEAGGLYQENGELLPFDTVSKATCSSNAILTACRSALQQAAEKESDKVELLTLRRSRVSERFKTIYQNN
ncbi:uncharacterized protein conserved in bacteria [Roseburia sp. CAG:303]|nr:uncharacterized protein conserved in bacteria [Roseburia sp. CAG:303]